MLLHSSPTLLLSLTAALSLQAQGPDLVGYWHNWNDAQAPYLELSEVDPRYSVIAVSFAVPVPGTTYDMAFSPEETTLATFLADMAVLQASGKKVLISVGGANATVHLDSDMERDVFVSSMLDILSTYGFDGVDIDLEGSSVSVTGGTIGEPVDARIIRMIDAVNTIAEQYETANGVPMMLTMAPETAYVQGGMSNYGGIWGAYLPLIDALRDRIDILQVQLYNSGSMYGIDGGIYTQGTADFIVSQTEALMQGFITSGGYFAPLPPERVAIGLPACPLAAGGGYVSPSVLASAVEHLRGSGPQPGSYETVFTYPALRGLMTWSINWDAAENCGVQDEFASIYEELFGITTGMPVTTEEGISVRPNPVVGGVLHVDGLSADDRSTLFNAMGGLMMTDVALQDGATMQLDLPAGTYLMLVERDGVVVARRTIVMIH